MFRNTLAQSLQFVVTTGFSLVLGPIMLAQLGLTTYGVWAVVGALVVYASLLDAGVARALARFVAYYHARGENERVRQCIGLGLLTVTIVGLVLVPAAWLTAPIVHAATDRHLSLADTRSILLASCAIFIAQGYTGALVALPHGLQQMMPPNVMTMIGNTVNFAASVAVLLTSGSLVIYAWANAAAEAFTILLVAIAARRVWRQRLAAFPSRAVVRDVLAYSIRVQASWLADLINMTADRILIGVFVDVRAAGAYALGASVAAGIRSVGVLTVSAMIPTATAEIVKGAGEAVRGLFRRYAPLTLGLSLPVFALGMLSAPYLIMAWLGERPQDATTVLVVLLLAYAANVATGVPTTTLLADGKPGFVSANAMATAAVNVVLSLALAPVLGLWGVLIGTGVAIIGLSVVLIVRFMRSYGLTRADARRAFLPPTLLAAGIAAPLVPLVVATAELADGRLSALPLLAGVTLLYGVPYWLLASRARLIPERLTPSALLRRPATAR